MGDQPDRMKTYDQIQILWRDACAVVVREIVAEAFDIPPELIISKHRGREYVTRARQVAVYLMHVVCGMSQTQVAKSFGRTRTAICHACSKVEDSRDDEYTDIHLDLLAERISERIDRIKLKNLQAQIPESQDWQQVSDTPDVQQGMPAQEMFYPEKKVVVGGDCIEDLPLVRTEQGHLLEFKLLK